ncbi:FAD-dependent monooxygenase [Gloeocapsopsis dulcis]|uniref:Monooxygenase n=1 Tax=Gloeocapsopsis dulcis AAB1 = 1H9 TaxID=1433147 RepID=A0A6N8FPJ5_9CHRO|nr:FAD-dependent monooxygenase [Gloeocapsopsis dulcis]MUL35061.1 monooxygenase [Gloeocapsopsis dulcis AAB1 = 1H9]WNN89861.1 FAD-dependent monooxygenase [Gloeocapsopsis dulcis]
MAQVVIVGAGPAGVTLALLLVKRGIRVKLIEASRNWRRAFRGEGLMPSGLDALEQMELLPILKRIPHQPLDAWEFIINKRSLFRVDEPIEPGGKPCTLVSQPAFLEALIDTASHYPHFEFVQGTAVQDLLWNQRVVGVKLSDGRNLDADLVIGTDGRNSIVRQRANLSLEQQSHSFDILWFKLADSPHFKPENVFYSILCDRYAFGLFRSSEGNLHLGWTLPKNFPQDWQQVDNWAEIFAAASPSWLAEHFRIFAATIERPVLLSVVVGRCPRWYQPGVLLLGDAAHPMSPIRAQGINMALRDAIAAANHLVPCLSQDATADIDAVLPQIQSQREPEIIKAQQLQSQEAAQAELLEKSALLRWGVSFLAPLIRTPVKLSWLHRQRELRQGVTPIKLTV